MSPDLERLIRLQDVETTLDEARRTIAAHPQRLAEADARLDDARGIVEAAQARLKDNHEARRALERDAAVFQGRIGKFKDQLSAVKTNREYQAMQVEIETAERELSAAEEKVLERMMEGDAIAADIKQAETALAAEKKVVDADRKALADELAACEATLAQASRTREALLGETEGRLVTLFEQVARARKGIAICTATHDGLCSVCHVRLRPHVFQQVRPNDSIVQCETCQRILYYLPPPAPAEAAATQT